MFQIKPNLWGVKEKELLFQPKEPNSFNSMKVLGLVMEKETADLQKFLCEKYGNIPVIVSTR